MPVDQEPTSSQQTNRLISLCQAVRSGTADPGTLEAYLQERRTGLAGAKADFLHRAGTEGDAFRSGFRAELDAMTEQFDLHAAALDEIGAFFEDHDPAHLDAGVESLVEHTPKLLQILEDYEAKYLAVGPTDFPMVNVLIKALPNVKSGRFAADGFKAMLAGAVDTFNKAMAEIDASPMLSDPGVPERRAAYVRILDGLARMQVYFSDGQASHLDSGLEIVEDGHHLLQAAMNQFRDAQFTGGPTPSPKANWVIAAAEGVRSGKYPHAILEQAVEWLHNETALIRENFEQTAATPTTSVLIQEELPKTMEAFDLMDEALAFLRNAAQPGSEGLIPQGVAQLQDAVKRLQDSQAAYTEAGEREGKVLCPQCQRPNAPESRRCVQCGMTLPRVMDEAYTAGALSTFEVRESQPRGLSEEDQMVMTTHLKRLFDSAEAVHANQITSEEFLEVLSWAEGLLTDAERRLAELPTLEIQVELSEEERATFEEQKAMADETKDLLRRGIGEFHDGLDTMRAYLDRRDQQVLVQGIRTVWEAARKIHQCQKMGDAVSRMEPKTVVPTEPAAPAQRRSDEVALEQED